MPEVYELNEETDQDIKARTRVQRLMEDMDGLKRAIRTDSSNSRAQAEQLLQSRSGTGTTDLKFTFA